MALSLEEVYRIDELLSQRTDQHDVSRYLGVFQIKKHLHESPQLAFAILSDPIISAATNQLPVYVHIKLLFSTELCFKMDGQTVSHVLDFSKCTPVLYNILDLEEDIVGPHNYLELERLWEAYDSVKREVSVHNPLELRH